MKVGEDDMEENLRAILVGVNINDSYYFYESFNELKELSKACNITPVSSIIQNLKELNSTFYVGNGKVSQIKEEALEFKADLVIFNNELSPSQLRNLESKLDIPILDRTALILEIFAIRAHTKEAKLQVEVAKLKYMLPRLVGLHESLGRQGGKAGISNKGSGETKLELDRRRIENKINELNKQLQSLEVQRNIQTRKRKNSNLPLISLVGYTNSGKSTILNTLLDIYGDDESKKVFQQDMLFATLDTSVRKIKITKNKTLLVSDTVGFIRELPHGLIKAFRSTLDEVKNADILLHIVDFSDEKFEENIKVTNETLKEIGADNIPVIYVYNKCENKLKNLPVIKYDSIYISAKEKVGIEEVIGMVSKKVFSKYIKCKFLFPFEKGNILSYLNTKYNILNINYTQEGTIIELECAEEDYNKYKDFILKE